MPIIIESQEINTESSNEGWTKATLVSPETIGAEAMIANRWSLQPNAFSLEIRHGEYEEFLYVISGSGTVIVGDERLPLEAETVLWLESGDRYQFEAGADGLEVLHGQAS